MAGVWSAYAEHLGERRAAHAMRHEAKSVLPHFGHLRPDQITADDCRAYTDARRAAGIADGSIHTELGRVRSACNWAAKVRLIQRAPYVPRPSKPQPKDRWLTEAEIARLLAAPMAAHTRLAVLLMLGTAARVTAVLQLEWSRVDMERRQIDLRTGEGGRKGRAVVPMNAMLVAALTEARHAAVSPYVIEWNGKPVADIKTGFRAACRSARLEGVSPHVLRHTAAVHMAAAGISMARISQYLGHSSQHVTERVYARFAPEHLRDAAEVLDFTKGKVRVVK